MSGVRRKCVLFCMSLGVSLFCATVVFLLKLLPDGHGERTIMLLDTSPDYWVEDVDYGDKFLKKDGQDAHDLGILNASVQEIKYPIILWWNPLTGDRGRLKSCDGKRKCLFTTDRHFQHHPQTKVFLFYGTDFDKEDIPLPRQMYHEWGLFHEESPKNNYLLTQEEVITLFNHTATFQRTSDYPLTTQYLADLKHLLSDDFFVPLQTKNKLKEELAPVVYIHTDCNPPSDRDSFAIELMKYIQVDSYGKCLHNKDLPTRLQTPLTWDDKELYKLLAQYKFTLTIENAICDDYITEKLWRPLSLGSVPIYKGSPTIRDWLPSNLSIILVDDFKNAQELAKYLKYLIQNDAEYEKYLQFRKTGVNNERLIRTMQHREWGVNSFEKINFITGFECFVCNRVHENKKRSRLRKAKLQFLAKRNHLHCPKPKPFDIEGTSNAIRVYQQMYDRSQATAKHLLKRFTSTRHMSIL